MTRLVTRNRGGHGSRPRDDNAIYELNAAVDQVAKLKLPGLSGCRRGRESEHNLLDRGTS